MVSSISWIILLVISVKLSYNLQFSPESFKKNVLYCKKQSATPYFDKNFVVGRPWRIYYSWNVEMDDKCLDFVVKNVTDAIITRIWYDMHHYLEREPNWKDASLHTTLGSTKHELLLINNGSIPGSFVGVPYVVGHDLRRLATTQNLVPLFNFFLKLVHNGKYLLMMDCDMGIATLLSRERPPQRAEVTNVARSLRLGDGAPACMSDTEKGAYWIDHNIA